MDFNFNIDIAIVAGFLILNLGVGLYYGRGVKNIKDYAVGNKKTYTSIIAASIIATWISGSFFTVSVSQTFKNGVWFVPAALGDIISLLIIGYILAPKMKEFLKHLSVAETMGELYGSKIRYVTATASIAQSIAMTALQIKVFSGMFSYFLDVSAVSATVISSFVVIFYSAWGGIKAVSITDALQFCTFGIFIPLFALFIWKTIGDTEATKIAFQTNPLLDFSQLLNYNDSRFLPNLTLMLWFLIPSLSSPTFQRTLMSKDTDQINKSFSIAAIGYTVIMIFICIIGLLILATDPELDANNIIPLIIDKHSFVGLKGITVIGIMAMVMSTADSWINVGSVILTHDICKPLGLKAKHELIMSRIFALIIGFSSVLLVLYSSSLFKLFSLQANFYMPIVTMPLLFAILGFRTTPIAIGSGMAAGIITVVIWKLYLTKETGIDSVVPSMLVNLITFFTIHYVFKQSGGWRDDKACKKKRKQSTENKLITFLHKLHDFDILSYYNKSLPKLSIIYSYFSFAVFLTIITTISIEKNIYNDNLYLINISQALVLFIAIFFLSNALWSSYFKRKFLGIVWHTSIFISLIFISSFLVLLSKFSHVSLTILTIHLIFVSMLVGWRAAFIMIPIGLWLSFSLYQNFIGEMNSSGIYDLKIKLLYILFIVGGFTMTILKSKQDQQEETESKVDTLGQEVSYLETEVTDLNHKVTHYSEQISDQEREIERLGATAQKILNNVNHELRLPVGNVMNFAEMLNEGLGKYDESQLKMLSDEVYKNSNRLSSMIMNMLDLAALNAKKLVLDKKTINISELVKDRVDNCRKIYLDGKKIDFILAIQPEILISVDPNYMRQVVDNLVINAIKFSSEGEIKITLIKQKSHIEFVISDNGIGILHKDIYDIFTPFKMGSNTESKAEGRGVGLALCKAAIEAHGGSITVDSKNGKGAIFKFLL